MHAAHLVQMAKLIWHFHLSPVPLKDEVTLVMSIWGHMGGRNEDENSEEDKEAIRLAREAGLRTSPFDKLMLEYLNHGYLSEDFQREFADEQDARRRAEELESEVDAVIHLYDKNFLSSEATIGHAAHVVVDGLLADAGRQGQPESSFRDTLTAIAELEGEEATAKALFASRHDAGIGLTAWGNRLGELHRLRVLDRRKQGKEWVYRPIVKAIEYGRKNHF